MTEFSITHEFDADPATFWRVYLDGGFHDAMYRAVGVVRSELSRVQSDEQVVIVARCASGAATASRDGAHTGGQSRSRLYRNPHISKRQPASNAIDEPTMLGDRVRFAGTIAVEPIGPGRVRRTYAGSIAVNIPLFGARIEKSTVNEMKRTHEEAAVVTRAWLSQAAA